MAKGRPQSQPKNQVDLTSRLVSGIRQAASRPTIYGYKPMEKQITFHSNPAKGRLFLGGNRSGKTVGGCTEDTFWLLGNHPYYKTPPPPVYGRVVAVDFKQGVEKIVKPELARWIPPSALLGGHWDTAFDKELNTLYFENGSFLEFMSYEQAREKFAGTSRHFVHFDEEPPHEIFTECLARLVDTEGHWWITMTPLDGMNWTYDDLWVQSKVDPNIAVIQVSMDENTYLSPGEIEQYISTLDKDEREARRHGKFVAMGGLIYKNFGLENIIAPVVETVFWPYIQKHWTHFLMMDHGFNNPTAWLWGAFNEKDDQLIIYDEWYRSGLVVKEHAEIVNGHSREIGIIPAYHVGDPSISQTSAITGTSVQTEYAENGIIIIPGNNSVKTGIDLVSAGFKFKRVFITRNCTHLLKELPKYRWATWSSIKMKENRNAKEEPNKKDDHACDALRYGVASRPEFYSMLGHVQPEMPFPGKRATKDDGLVDSLAGRLPNFGEKTKDVTDFTLGDEW